MPHIRFFKARPEIVVTEGANLMRSLLDASLPVASSCGGDGVCAKCRVRVLEGMEHLSSETELERDLRDRHDYDENERVSCQVSVHGDILIDASYW